MIQAYSTSIFPAIPVLDVFFSFPGSDDWKGPFSAIVDSGADYAIAPLSLLQSFNLPVVRPVTLNSLWQDKRNAYVYEVDIRIGEIVLPAIDVAGDRVSDQILLGRNVLNKLDLRLEGPKQRTHML